MDDAVAAIKRWWAAGAVDGFMTAGGEPTRSMDLALEELMPRLSEAGLLRSEYSGNTFN